MTKICEICDEAFETDHRRKYCSKECRKAGLLRKLEENRKRKAATRKRWKTYKEIQAENRRRKIEDGWRGRKMQGSGINEKQIF